MKIKNLKPVFGVQKQDEYRISNQRMMNDE